MQGTYLINERQSTRPPTKKALKAAVAADPANVALEATSWFGNEYDGRISEAPDGSYYVVGPDPHTSRKWYAQVIVAAGKVVVR